MKRKLSEELNIWLKEKNHKPLILRGARQTGKTYIVRQLAETSGRQLIELNFERNPEYGELFDTNRPDVILQNLELMLGVKIDFEKSILFLDEIQACAFILSKLRWFYEDCPALPVIAAGSLLEFALDEYEDSMPVGRVTYRYLHPFSFTEFLWAMGEGRLASHLLTVREDLQLPNVLHEKYLEYYRQYILIGGMPEAVKKWKEKSDVRECIRLQKDLLTSFQDDFNKYRNRVPAEVLRKTMLSIPAQLGGKFVYNTVDRDQRQPVIKKAIELLEKAGLCKRVYATSGNGVPLGAEKYDRIFKNIFLDSGLAMNVLGIRPVNAVQLNDILWANNGAMAEQICGQLMLSLHSHDDDELFYWQQSGSGTGEINYLTQKNDHVLPIEVKAGKSGSMKSLHAFMEKKKLTSAVRFDLNPPSIQNVDVKTTQGREARYTLLSLPLYMVEYL